ncbi:alkaline phosphatase, partial [Streptomyces sp. NPDC005534]
MSLDPRRARRFAAPSAAAVAAAVVTMVVNPTLGASASAPQATAKAKTPTAKNVIFINGDGMGAAMRQAARLHLAGLGGRLAMDKLPVSGQLTTEPDDPKAVVTDSAAAATAWA